MKRLLVLAVVFLMMVGCKRCQECQCSDDNYYEIFEVCRDNYKSNDDYKLAIDEIETEPRLLHTSTQYGWLSCECKPDILW